MVKILYCSSTELGETLHDWLVKNSNSFVYGILDNQRISSYPDDYELGVSFLYTHKIPAEQVKNHTWINFHPGPLPEMRGRNLAYHAIMEGREEFGATLHYMDENYDTGKIIQCRRFPIPEYYTAGDLVRLTHETLREMFLVWMPIFLKGVEIPGMKQGEGAYYHKININEFLQLRIEQQKLVKALTVAGKYYARIEMDGKNYRIVPEEEL